MPSLTGLSPTRGAPPGAPREPSLTTRYGRAALHGCADRVAQASKGLRHRTLFAASCEAGRLVAGGELAEGAARTTLLDMGLTIGLVRVDAEHQIDRGMAAGWAEPKRAPDRPGGALFTATDARVAALDWWAQVSADPALRTRRGTTTLRLLAGFALLAMAAGKVRLSDSYRQLAEVAGISVGTVTKHRAALAPYVRQVKVHRRTEAKATSWQLVQRPGHLETLRRSRMAAPPVLFPNGHPLDHPGHNFWHRRSGWWLLWCSLDPAEGLTVAELAHAAGRTLRTARRILAALRADGLAVAVEGRWCRQEGAVEPVVEVDHAEARRARHAAQRDAWRRRVAALVADREAERALPPAERAERRRERQAVQLARRARRYEARARGGRPLPFPGVERAHEATEAAWSYVTEATG